MNELTRIFGVEEGSLQSFDSLKIGIASPERIRACPTERSKSQRPSTTARSSLSVTAFLMRVFLARRKTMSVSAASTSA